jgi:hypothetical protein
LGYTGKKNSQVLAYYETLFTSSLKNPYCQVLCTALCVYVTSTVTTNTLLGQMTAEMYGFIVNSTGTGGATYNVGSYGAAFGVTNNTTWTILQLLQKANAKASNGVLNSSYLNAYTTVFSTINQNGDIPS